MENFIYETKILSKEKQSIGVHIQAYIGRKASHGKLRPIEHRKVANEPMVLHMPVDSYIEDHKEPETYKLINRMSIVLINNHCLNVIKTFMLFVSEKEINCSKSSVLNKFCGAKSLKDFVNMKLPIKQISNQLN